MSNKEYILKVLEDKKTSLEKQAENQRSMAESKFIHHREPYQLGLATLLKELDQCNQCITTINNFL